MKSPIDKAIYFVKNRKTGETIDTALLLEYLEELKEDEKTEMTQAWVNGNQQGWKMISDWEEDGEEYYENRFKES